MNVSVVTILNKTVTITPGTVNLLAGSTNIIIIIMLSLAVSSRPAAVHKLYKQFIYTGFTPNPTL